jgi:hypothetical protein
MQRVLLRMMSIEIFALVFSFISIVVTAIIGFFSLYFLRKQHRINGLQDAFKILNTSDHRLFRNRVYQVYHEYNDTKNIQVFRNPEVESVRADFDVIALLVRNKNINKELFLREYGPLAFDCWRSLKASIEDERQRRKFEHYMENFEWLAKQARKFWAKKGEDLTKREIYDTRQKP